MKRILSLVTLLNTVFTAPVAAQSYQGTLQVQLRDGQPLTLVLDGRHFRKYGNILTVGNIPKGMHELKAYYYYPATDHSGRSGRGGRDRAVLIFKGRMQIDGGKTYYCMIDPSNGTLKVRESRMSSVDERNKAFPIDNRPDFSDGRNDESWEYDKGRNDQSSQVSYYNERNRITAAQMEMLRTSVEDKISTTDKVRTIKLFLSDKTLMTEQVITIMNWLNFESNKLEIATYCYPRVSDPDNYILVSNKLSFQSSRRTLEQEMLRIKEQGPDTAEADPSTGAASNEKLSPLTEQRLAALQQACDQKVSDSEKIKLLQSGLARTTFTVAQLSKMLHFLLFEGTRLELVKWAYTRISDPQNTASLKSEFNYTSSKNEIDQLSRSR
ncbi:MAG: DUF4476 domain-containing protein [Chitinophagaceae bacterium]